MGSVLDQIECPNCKQEATMDFYYKTGEEYVFCQNCGYNHSHTYRRDENGELVTKDGTDDYSFDNLIMDVKELKHPYGAFRVHYEDSVGYGCGSLENEESYDTLKASVLSMDGLVIDYATVSRFIDGEIKEEVLVNKKSKQDEI
jgi:Zn ribbon nucleic-acid-binding protein